jgi:hypothetical protein
MKTTEQLNTFTSVETKDKQESSIDVNFENIENTPFTIVEQNGEYFGTLGNHRLTDIYEDKEECKKDLTEITWNRLVQVIWGISEKFNKIKIEENE